MLVINLLVVAAIMLLAAWKQPIWLDEQYSLFFAKTFSPSQLMIHFTVDPHPGLYYLCLKLLLRFSNNLFVVRLVSSVIPSFLGLATLLFYGFKHHHRRSLLLFGPMLFLNPLVINLSWQLRMYGVVIFFTCIFYVFLDRWIHTKNLKWLLLLTPILLTGPLFHYSLIWLTIGLLCLISLDTGLRRTSTTQLWALTTFILLCFELYLTSGSSKKLDFVGWIPTPNIASISSNYLTLLGLSGDFFSKHLIANTIDFIMVFCLILGLLAVIKQKLYQNKFFLFFGLLPCLVILVCSFAFPTLSHLPFFYHFVPNASLFIPRVHLPFLILGTIYLTEKITLKKQSRILLALITGIWIVNSFSYNVLRNQTSNDVPAQVQSILKMDQQTLLFPRWLEIENINPNSLDQTYTISSKMKNELEIETAINRGDFICNLVTNKNISVDLIQNQADFAMTRHLNAQLQTCCEKTSSLENFTNWKCQVQ